MASNMSGCASTLRAQQRRPQLIRMTAVAAPRISNAHAFSARRLRTGARSFRLARQASSERRSLKSFPVSGVSNGLRFALNDASISTRSDVDACKFLPRERAFECVNAQLVRDMRRVVGQRTADSRRERHDSYARRRV